MWYFFLKQESLRFTKFSLTPLYRKNCFFYSTGDTCRIDQYKWDLVDQHFIQNSDIFDKTCIQ